MAAADTISIPLATEDDTQTLAAFFAGIVHASDVLLLEGEIGAGKSAFARALIRARASAMVEVPSPTFTLVQTYAFDDLTIWHCDLYRLTQPDEALELGLEEAFEKDVCLIEWPDRLGDAAPKDALRLAFAAQTSGHHVTITPPPAWAGRLAPLHD